ncbi:MAG: hypothetical protein HYY16_09240 [Planctomycetes bacterium]|nr:hypothetical protein [Planctomycetota bacterium]
MMQRHSRGAVLVVDTERARLERVLGVLSARGFQTRSVSSVRDACSALQRSEFDIVLVSDAKPLEMLREMRSAAALSRVVVLGDCRDWATCVELAALGTMDVISPLTCADEVARRLRKLMGREAAA